MIMKTKKERGGVSGNSVNTFRIDEIAGHLVDVFPVAILISNMNGDIVFANNNARTLFGINEQPLPGEFSMNKIHGQNPAKWNKAFDSLMKKGYCHFEGKSKTATGGSIQIDVVCRLTIANGEDHVISYIRDISDQKIFEQEFFKEQHNRQLILDAIPAMVFAKDKENRIVSMNKTYSEITGLSIDDVIGKRVDELVNDPKLADKYWKDDLEVIETGIPKRNIVEPLLNNPKKWFITDKIPLRSPGGEIIGVIGFSIDITERKHAEESLMRSEKKFRMLYDTSPDGIVLSSIDGKIIAANKAFQNLLGYSAEEIENLTYEEITPEKYRQEEWSLIEDALDSENVSATMEKEYITKDNRYIPVKVTGWVMKDDEGNPFQLGAYVKDLTYERKAQALERSLLQKEKEQLEHDLETKNKELNLKVTQLIEKNQLVTTVVKQLERLIKEKPKTFGEEIKSIIHDLKHHDKEDFWSQFEYTFGQVNQSFYENLFRAYPNLTNNEKKISAFLKMNLSTKDISTITHQSIRSIEMARSRLRKKLNLPRSENLSKFLNQF